MDKVFFMIMSVGRGRREECEEEAISSGKTKNPVFKRFPGDTG